MALSRSRPQHRIVSSSVGIRRMLVIPWSSAPFPVAHSKAPDLGYRCREQSRGELFQRNARPGPPARRTAGAHRSYRMSRADQPSYAPNWRASEGRRARSRAPRSAVSRLVKRRHSAGWCRHVRSRVVGCRRHAGKKVVVHPGRATDMIAVVVGGLVCRLAKVPRTW